MSGRSRGFAHLDFNTQAHADQAMEELAGVELLGRALRIDHAAKKSDSMNRANAAPILSVRHLEPFSITHIA
jgi:RNA recognition motif-containing protein